MMRRLRCLPPLAAAVLIALVFVARAGLTAAQEVVDLELVLAIDASSSVDESEFVLQLEGLAAAFRNPALLAAITAVGQSGIAVSLVQWSSGGRQAVAIDWTRVWDAASAEHLAKRFSATPRLIGGGDTSLRGAINFSARQFDGNGLEGLRKVIDISGDGGAVVTSTANPDRARDAAVARGITINGLTVLDEVPELHDYYRKHVIGGAGAFVQTAASYQDFAEAMLRKLIQEISDRPLAEVPGEAPETAPDETPDETQAAARPDQGGLVPNSGEAYLTGHE